jgi:hypothetical protein
MIVPGQARTAMLTDAEATFLDQLVTAAAVLEQRCTGYGGGQPRQKTVLARYWRTCEA